MSTVLIMGLSDAGKTVYGAQLWGLIQDGTHALKSRSSPDKLYTLQHALERLEEGKAPEHTALGTFDEIHLPLFDEAGQAHEVVWPDYGGEQLRQILEDRVVPSRWLKPLEDAERWLILLRLGQAHTPVSALDNPAEVPAPADAKDPEVLVLPTEAQWIELLQILWWVREGFPQRPARLPALALVLSCYDELAVQDTPRNTLASTCPLLPEFLENTWHPNAIEVFGLSAQGGPLERVPEADAYRQTFLESGTRHRGYLVAPNGVIHSDLTEPLRWLLERA